MEGVSTKQPARMTLPRPPAGSGGFASWSFHCAYWGAYIIFVGLFALRVAPTPGRCYRAPPLRLPLGPDNFGPPNLSPDNNLLRSFLSFASIVLLLNAHSGVRLRATFLRLRRSRLPLPFRPDFATDIVVIIIIIVAPSCTYPPRRTRGGCREGIARERIDGRAGATPWMSVEHRQTSSR